MKQNKQAKFSAYKPIDLTEFINGKTMTQDIEVELSNNENIKH